MRLSEEVYVDANKILVLCQSSDRFRSREDSIFSALLLLHLNHNLSSELVLSLD